MVSLVDGTHQTAHFFRQAFLRQDPQRYAVMLAPDLAQRCGQKYHEQRGPITDALIRRHLSGQTTLAAPAAVDGQAHLLPLDSDAGGMPAITQLIAAAHARGLWAFGQSCPRIGLAEEHQHGYVWLPFAEPTDAARLQLLGEQLLARVARPGWKVEPRAHAAATRLPLARHTHTGRFGALVLVDCTCSIDHDPTGAQRCLWRAFRENPISRLPTPALPAPETQQKHRRSTSSGPDITIDRYNHDTDLVALLERYGARMAQGSRRLLHCCGHPDRRRASLLLWTSPSAKRSCRCLSQHHDCPLSGPVRDAFGVYCAMEGLCVEDALRRLNGREVAR